MHRILILPDIRLAGYPAGRISGQYKSRLPDIRCRPDTGYLVGFATQITKVKNKMK
jgi:hypothetical protein